MWCDQELTHDQLSRCAGFGETTAMATFQAAGKILCQHFLSLTKRGDCLELVLLSKNALGHGPEINTPLSQRPVLLLDQ